MFERRFQSRFHNDFYSIHARSQKGSLCYCDIHLWRYGVDWDCDVIGDVGNGRIECIIPIWIEIYARNVRFDSRLIFLIILYSIS